MSYAETYQHSLTDPEGFWATQAQLIPWFEPPETIVDQDPNGAWRWFRGGKLNSCYVALDQHVAAGRGDATALIYDSPATNTVAHYSFAQLTDWTARVAGALQRLGVGKVDR
ncbi:MAG: acetyl-coenzyme A synthetase N-terminal domain-containing protein, partial [Pseudomonadales bacterium]|nr:acetyl-coenzyme A synthetase N-terminal domain-containing protein [Pseudomonadales bacterium]